MGEKELNEENINKFFNMYKKGNIIYPSAVARYFSISQKEAYNLCYNRLGQVFRRIYQIKCPRCNCIISSNKLYTDMLMGIDKENNEVTCLKCDNEFKPDNINDIVVAFEKIR